MIVFNCCVEFILVSFITAVLSVVYYIPTWLVFHYFYHVAIICIIFYYIIVFVCLVFHLLYESISLFLGRTVNSYSIQYMTNCTSFDVYFGIFDDFFVLSLMFILVCPITMVDRIRLKLPTFNNLDLDFCH